MRKLDVTLCISIIVLVLLIAFSVAMRWNPFCTIESIRISGISANSSQKLINSLIYRNYYGLRHKEIKEQLEGLGYIDSASMSYENGVLALELSNPENGVILDSGKRASIYDGKKLISLDRADIKELESHYIKIDLEEDYHDYLERYGSDEFNRFVAALFDLDEYSALISRAEYDNNNITGSGNLTLVFDSLNSELGVSGVQNINRLIDSVKAIEGEFSKNPIKALNGPMARYELRSSELVRIKR